MKFKCNLCPPGDPTLIEASDYDPGWEALRNHVRDTHGVVAANSMVVEDITLKMKVKQ